MSLFHPTRGGTRGGRDQFKWEDVKSSKDRELYLGHSVQAPIVSRSQAGKDILWYTKAGTGQGGSARRKTKEEILAEARLEAAEFNRQEEQLRLEELGLAPRVDRRALQREQVDAQDQAQLLRQIHQQSREEREEAQAALSGRTQVGLLSSLNPKPQPLTKAEDPALADRLHGLGGGRSNKHYGHEFRSIEDRVYRPQEQEETAGYASEAPAGGYRAETFGGAPAAPLSAAERQRLEAELQEALALEERLLARRRKKVEARAAAVAEEDSAERRSRRPAAPDHHRGRGRDRDREWDHRNRRHRSSTSSRSRSPRRR